MSEFDFYGDYRVWSNSLVAVNFNEVRNKSRVIKEYYNMTRGQVLEELKKEGIISYRLERIN